MHSFPFPLLALPMLPGAQQPAMRGHTVEAIPLDSVRAILSRYKVNAR